MSEVRPRLSLILLFAGFILWLFCFQDFLAGRVSITGDTVTNYAILKFYFNNLLVGNVPLWDPYVYNGRPFIYIGSSGALNPFAYVMPILVMASADYYQAYIAFITGYYFLGILGFYLLSKKVLRSEPEALIGTLLLLFSGMGAMLFKQIFVVYLFVPCVWFFVFFLRFRSGFRRADFLGLVFTAMLLVISYLPFYFLTLFLAFSALSAAFYPAALGSFIKETVAFVFRYKWTAAFSLIALALICVPLVAFKAGDSGGSEFISPARHQGEKVGAADETSKSGLQMSFAEVAYNGTLAERMKGGRLFSQLDNFGYFSDDFFYIPIFVCIVLVLSLVTPFCRKKTFLFLLTFLVFLLSMGAVTPVYRILYDHIGYFKFFRNLFFYMAYLIPLIILLAMMQLQSFRNQLISGHSARVLTVLHVIVIHALLFALLAWHGDILLSSYWTVGVSLLVFCLLAWGRPKSAFLMLICMIALALPEPVEVFKRHAFNSAEYNCVLPSKHVRPEFSYTRPSQDMSLRCLLGCDISGYVFYLHMSSFKDTSGAMVNFPDLVSKDVFRFFTQIYRRDIFRFIQSKFWVYDRVEPWQGIAELRSSLKSQDNAVFVESEDPRLQDMKVRDPSDFPVHPQAVQGKTAELSVTHFGTNGIEFRTSFPVDKFLVYTEAFGSGWKIWIDGKEDILYKAQGGFKGILVPAGPHTVQLAYTTRAGAWIYLLPLAAIFLVMIWLVVNFLSDRKPLMDVSEARTTGGNFSVLRCSAVFYLGVVFVLSMSDFSIAHHSRLDNLKVNYLLSGKQAWNAILYFDYRVHLNPKDAQAYAELAKNYYIVGKRKEAVRALSAAIRLDPEYRHDQALKAIYLQAQ